MGYRVTLVRRWTRRDRLAIVVIAVTVAFFTGATLVVAAVAAQTSQMAAELGPVGYVTTNQPSITLPVASLADGGTYVGVPRTPGLFEVVRATVPSSETITHGVQRGRQSVVLVGTEGELSTTVGPRPGTQSLLPGDWYAGPTEYVRELGQTDKVTLREAGTDTSASTGTPLRGALTFFILGTRSLLALLRLLTIGAAVLVAVTVYSVIRMVVRDRQETITVVRATGATSRDIAVPFIARAGLLTAVGVLLGYAVGVVLPNAAINIAVFAGLPVSLDARVTVPTLTTLLPGYAGILLAGLAAGAVAVRPAIRGAPGANTAPRSTSGGRGVRRVVPESLQPGLLGWRPFIPAVTALTVFVVLTVLLASVGAALAPMFAPTGATVTEPGASHTFASTVPSAYADGLESGGVAASPEIVLFSVARGSPFLARGALFGAFSNVTDAELVAGREPRGRHEAVIGADLARTLNLSVGETVVLGGSTTTALTRVEIVGRFEATGITDDQLIVSLPTARHLSGKPPGTVQFIRLSQQPATNTSVSGVQVMSLTAPETAVVEEQLAVQARVVNFGEATNRREVALHAGTNRTTQSVRLGAYESTTLTFPVQFHQAGEQELTIGETNTTVTVQNRSALQIGALPDRAPPNSSLIVRAHTAGGDSVSNATVSLGTQTARTGPNGTTTVEVPQATGTYTLSVGSDGATVQKQLRVTDTATKHPLVAVHLSPRNPSVLTEPTVTVSLTNPWADPWTGPIHIKPLDRTTRVSIDPGETIQRGYQLARQSPGEQTIAVQTDGSELAAVSYQVTGDDRVVSALATRANSARGTGISRAIRTVFGNLQVLLGTFIGLGALVTIGSVTAGFAYAIRARRETIGMLLATGARTRSILFRVVADAVRVGAPALGIALIGGYGAAVSLTATGYTTMFGIRISPLATPTTVAVIGVAGMAVVILGSLAAAVPLVRAEPQALLESGENA